MPGQDAEPDDLMGWPVVPTSGLSRDELRRKWATHRPRADWYCVHCCQDWPCKAVLLLEIIERLGHH